MDFLDSPAVNYRKSKPLNSFQQELKHDLKKRKSRGLAVDLTSDDSEDEPSDLHPVPATRGNRPLSAKRRGNKSATTYEDEERNTPRSGRSISPKGSQGSNFFKSNKSLKGTDLSKTSKMTDRGWQTLDTLNHEDRGLSNEDLVFGHKKQQAEKHRENQGRTTPNIFEKDHRKTPTELDKKDKKKGIFGRKTPTKEDKKFSPRDYNDYGETDWAPPVLSKVNKGESDRRSISPASSVGGGRKTPSYDTSLDFLRESPRSSSYREKEKSITLPEGPGKGSKLYDNKKPSRKTPSPDIFGKTSRDLPEVDLDEDESLKETPRDRRRLGANKNVKGTSGRKTPTDKKEPKMVTDRYGRKVPAESPGRKTPTDLYGRKTPEILQGRKTPTGKGGRKSPLESPTRKSPTDLFGIKNKQQGRKTPISGRSARKEEGEEEIQEEKKASSLFDFLHDEPAGPKPKERRRLLRSESHDSITDEISAVDNKTEQKIKPKPRSKNKDKEKQTDITVAEEMQHTSSPPADASSICEELDQEPEHAKRKESPTMLELSASTGKERSDKHALNEVINMVSSAQSQMRSTKIKPINPDKVKPKIQTMLHRPKPRYGSAPGTPAEKEKTFDNAQDIRDAVYQEWYFNRMKDAKKREKERKKKEEEKIKKKEAEEQEKKVESQKSYEAWKEKKQDYVLSKKEEEHKKKMKENAKAEEERQKKADAEKAFKLWKEWKDEQIVETVKEKHEKENEKKVEEKTVKLKKKQLSVTAYVKWKSKKDSIIEKTQKEKDYEKKMKEKMERKEKEKREMEASKLYEKWLHRKELYDKRQKQLKHSKRFEEDEFKPAWTPAGRNIPFGR